jgi:hypothetical protein
MDAFDEAMENIDRLRDNQRRRLKDAFKAMDDRAREDDRLYLTTIANQYLLQAALLLRSRYETAPHAVREHCKRAIEQLSGYRQDYVGLVKRLMKEDGTL